MDCDFQIEVDGGLFHVRNAKGSLNDLVIPITFSPSKNFGQFIHVKSSLIHENKTTIL